MRQFVREQAPAIAATRRKLSGREDDVGTDREGVRTHRSGRLRRGRPGVHAHRAEISSETSFEIAARRPVQSLTRRGNRLLDD